jgi:hypothetical protein
MSETMLPPNHPHQDLTGIKPPQMPNFERVLTNAPPASIPEGATAPARKGAGAMDPKEWDAMEIRRRGCFAADAVLRVDSIVPGATDEKGRPLIRPEDDAKNVEASRNLLTAIVDSLLSSDPDLARGRSAGEIVDELMELGLNARILKLKENTPTISKLKPADAENFYQTVLGEVRNELMKIPEA